MNGTAQATVSAETKRHVELLRVGVRETLLTPLWTAKTKRSRYLHSAIGAPAAIAGLVEDIYVATAVTTEEIAQERGQAKRVNEGSAAGLVGVPIDFDVIGTPDGKGGVKQTGAPDLDAALTASSLVVVPTLIVASGGGIQPWFLFDKPVIFTSEEQREQAKLLGAQWQEAHRKASGFPIDATHDLARLMRLAGTRNYKGGGDGTPVKILADDGPRYRYAELAELVSDIEVNASSNGQRAHFNGKVSPERLEELIAKLSDYPGFSERWNREPDEYHADDNRYDLSIANKAVSRGLTDDEIHALLIANRLKHNPDDQKIYREDYFALTIGKARAERPQSDPKTYTIKVGKDGKLTLPPKPKLDDVSGLCKWLTVVFALDPKHPITGGRRLGVRGPAGVAKLTRLDAAPLMFNPVTRLNTASKLTEALSWDALPSDDATPPFTKQHCTEISHVVRMLLGLHEALTEQQETAGIIGTFLGIAEPVEGKLRTHGTTVERAQVVTALQDKPHGRPRYVIDADTGEYVITVNDLNEIARRQMGMILHHGVLEARMDDLDWERVPLQGHSRNPDGSRGRHKRVGVYRGILAGDEA